MAKSLKNFMRGARRKPKAEDVPNDDDPIIEDDDPDADADGDDQKPNASDDDSKPDASDEDPDPDAADNDDDDGDYTVEDEETDEEMSAAVRGSNRVLAIIGSEAGLKNPSAALKLAKNPRLSSADAIDLLADMPANGGKSSLDDRLRGRAKALGPDGKKPKPPSNSDRRATARQKYINRLENGSV